MSRRQNETPLSEQAARLRSARAARGFSDAAAVAAFFGWNYTTYSQHERGQRGLTRVAGRYAKALRVSESWLLTGEGLRDSNRVAVHGRIGAGAIVTMQQDVDELAAGDWFEFPNPSECWAFVVEGDSMRPRFFPGEIVVFSTAVAERASLIGQYCLVQALESGDRLVKILRKGRGADLWRLESHNADPIEDVALLAAYPWVATFRPRDGADVVVPDLASSRLTPARGAGARRA